METQIEPYLFFNGCSEEAINYYEKKIGAERQVLIRFADSPEELPEGMLSPGWENKVMHAAIRLGDSVIMLSDGCGPEDIKFQGFSLSIIIQEESELRRIFEALAEDGEVEMPLGQTFWSPLYGMLTDKFGLSWMLSLPDQSFGK